MAAVARTENSTRRRLPYRLRSAGGVAGVGVAEPVAMISSLTTASFLCAEQVASRPRPRARFRSPTMAK